MGITSVVSEPAAANHGNFVFMTGNWWAARSIDGGNSFSFVNPFSDFAFMCCDQDVVYNDKHDVWIWYRQGLIDPSLGGTTRNNVRLNVSTDDAATWCIVELTASDIDSGLTDHFIDYPHLQTTDDLLYITSNIFDNFGFFDSSILMRFDLSELRSCDISNAQVFLTTTSGTLTTVNGATDTMYFANQQTSSTTKIRSIQDSSTTILSNTVSHPSYATSGHSCPMPDTGANPCGRGGSRIRGGYLSNGVLGFAWNAAQDLAFPFPYVNYITVDASTGSLLLHSPIFSNTVAHNYANFGVNNVGDIGVGLFRMGGTETPSYLIGIDDSQTGTNQFDFVTVKTSTDGPGTTNRWGDYVRVKPFEPDNGQWVGTGFTMQGGTTNSDVENLFVIFGRSGSPTACNVDTTPSQNTIISSSCTVTSTITAGGSVRVESGAVMTIPNLVTLDIDFTTHNLTVESGSGVLIESGGSIT